MSTVKVDETKPCFIAWTNTDLTEGRGKQIPLAVAWLESTARRLGKRGGVQGCNCRVIEDTAFRVGSHWYAPTRIISSSAEDDRIELERTTHLGALQRARDAGVSEQDLAILRGVET